MPHVAGFPTVGLEGHGSDGSFYYNTGALFDFAASSLAIGGTAVTDSAAELNALAGQGMVAADVAKLHAITSTAAELNTLSASGVTNADLVKLHAVTSTATELNVLHSVTAGTVAASSGVVVDAQKSIDTVGVRSNLVQGGTGVAGAASTANSFVKTVTGIADNTATSILTVTVPNAAHGAAIRITILASLGAGGAIGAFQESATIEAVMVFTRTAGVSSAGAVGTITVSSNNARVAGADAAATYTLAVAASAGGVGSTDTHAINLTIAHGAGASTNHQAVVYVEVLNSNASGITAA